LDHPIPGFVDAFKTKERAHQEYIRKTEELNGKLIQVANISSKISGAFQSLQSWQGEYQTIIINRRKMMQNFEGYIRHVEAQVNKLLADYRQINRRHRMSPAPQYFETTWKFPEYTIQSIDEDRLAAEFKDRLQVVYKNIQDIQNDLAQEIRRLPTVITSVAKVLNK
jgi:DNA repair exonuclease SbcCD ATPase subunit